MDGRTTCFSSDMSTFGMSSHLGFRVPRTISYHRHTRISLLDGSKYDIHMPCRCSREQKDAKNVESSSEDPVAMYTDQIENNLENVPFSRDVGTSLDAQRDPENKAGGSPPSFFQESEFVLILAACCIGVSTGVGVVIFNDAVTGIRHYIWGDVTVLDGRQLLERIPWEDLYPRLFFPPVIASFVVGCISAVTSRDTYHQSRTVMERMGRIGSSIIGLGSGVSLGPEGPSVEIGVDISQVFVKKFTSGKKHITSLIAAGSGAGVAAGFNAPISGVFFAVESVLQREAYVPKGLRPTQEKESSGLSIAMVLLASVLAAVVSQAGLGSSPAFLVPDYSLESLYELPLYIIFGGICGVVSSLFLYTLELTSDSFRFLVTDTSLPLAQGSEEEDHKAIAKQRLYTIGLPVVGGLITGIFALKYPEILYEGFDNVNSVLNAPHGDYSIEILIEIVLLKIVATSICRGTGLKGGIYAPSIFMGAALGSAFGLSCQSLADIAGLAVSPPQAFALVGVGAMLASACDVPLTSILLLFELTRDYLIILPTLAAVGISYWISTNFLLWKQSNPLSSFLQGKENIPTGSSLMVMTDTSPQTTCMQINDGIHLTVAQICALLEENGEHTTAIITNTQGETIAKVTVMNDLQSND